MNSFWLPLKSIEPVEIYATDAGGSPIVGMTDLYAAIRRTSDNEWLDFSDNTFKAAGWIQRQQVMTQIDPGLAPGFYTFTFNTTYFPTPDIYIISVQELPPTVFTTIATSELRIGGVPDDCVSSRKTLLNRQNIDPGSVGNLVIYDDDDVTPWRTANVTGISGEAIAIPAATPSHRSRGV
jgi:hypothetical protein